jgi:hypothetical protein
VAGPLHLDLTPPEAMAAPVPQRKPPQPARPALVGMGVDDGRDSARADGQPAPPPVSLSFANNSSYLDERATRALAGLSKGSPASRICQVLLQATVASVGVDRGYARWLATRRMARVEEALRSQLPNRPLVFQHKLRERDDSRSVLVVPRLSPDCRTVAGSIGSAGGRS